MPKRGHIVLTLIEKLELLDLIRKENFCTQKLQLFITKRNYLE